MLKRLTAAVTIFTAIAATSASAASHHSHTHHRAAGVTGASNALPPLSYSGSIAPFGLASHVDLPGGSFELSEATADAEAPAQIVETPARADIALPTSQASAGTASSGEAHASPLQVAPSFGRDVEPAGVFTQFDDNTLANVDPVSTTELAISEDAFPVTGGETIIPDARATPRQRDEHLASIVRANTVRRAPAPVQASSAGTETAQGGPALTFQLRR